MASQLMGYRADPVFIAIQRHPIRLASVQDYDPF